jgi:hypothetical protein
MYTVSSLNGEPEMITREQWLNAAVDFLRGLHSDIPPVKVSCSFPGGGSKLKRIGECWPTSRSSAGINELFISPLLDDSAKVVSILTHEVAHAIDDCKHGHHAEFAAIGRRLGLVGKPTSMQLPDDVAKSYAEKIIAKVGCAFPHKTLDVSAVKKQTTRQLKLQCRECGVIWRMSQTAINMARDGLSCPCCQSQEIK